MDPEGQPHCSSRCSLMHCVMILHLVQAPGSGWELSGTGPVEKPCSGMAEMWRQLPQAEQAPWSGAGPGQPCPCTPVRSLHHWRFSSWWSMACGEA